MLWLPGYCKLRKIATAVCLACRRLPLAAVWDIKGPKTSDQTTCMLLHFPKYITQHLYITHNTFSSQQVYLWVRDKQVLMNKSLYQCW